MADIRTTSVNLEIIPGFEADIRSSSARIEPIVLPKGDIRTTNVLLQVIVMANEISAQVDKGGFDVEFELPIVEGTTGYLSLRTNVRTSEQGDELETEIRFYGSNDDIVIESRRLTTGDLVEKVVCTKEDGADGGRANNIRVLWANNFCSVYINDRWFHSFIFGYVHFVTTEVDLRMYADATWDGSTTINSVVVHELSDWREAIYVDTESTLWSSLSAIIQDRPVEIYVTSDGKMKFSYYEDRNEIVISPFVREHDVSKQSDTKAGSEAIVYATEVKYISDAAYTATGGFVTRVLRVPTLDVGAKRAAEVMLHKAKEREEMHTLTCRPDLRVEVGDLLLVYYIDHGQYYEKADWIIVESVTMNMLEPASSMSIVGRSYVTRE